MVEVRRITIADTYALGHQILRPHQTIDQCRSPGDSDDVTAHFGAFDADELVGILSIYNAQPPDINTPNSWQLRAMATSENGRGKGYGFKLLQAAESYAAQYHAQCIWANGRSAVIGFYEKAGYSVVNEEFSIPEIGPHFLASKNIG